MGGALAIYGLAGIVMFIVLAVAVARPLERARTLSESVDSERAALIVALGQAETTIRQMSLSVTRMDTSLADAKTAIDHASSVSHGLASSMYSLRDAMSLSVFGAQPLIGLATSFDTSGQNLDQLATDVSTIGTSLDANRTDVTSTARNMLALADSVHTLTSTVAAGPAVSISTRTLDAIRLAVYAVAAWLVLLAVGCLVGGIYLLNVSRRSVPTD